MQTNRFMFDYSGSAGRFAVQHLLRSREIGDIFALPSSVLQVGAVTVVTVMTMMLSRLISSPQILCCTAAV